MKRPSRVWMVAPVLVPTESGVGVLPAKVKSNREQIAASATVASRRANWSPTHLREPPPKGK